MLVKKALSVAGAFTLIATIGSRILAQSLREQADSAGILVGAAVAPSFFSEASYASTLAREFNMLEPENVMKIHGFMHKVGALKNMPAAWQDLFFPEAHGLKGN